MDPRPDVPRPEHPRPGFFRPRWQTLNGTWDFKVDSGDSGVDRGWAFDPAPIDERIVVPFCPESPLSGIGRTDFMEVVWYHRTFEIDPSWRRDRVLLHFGAVDWSCRVWVDGHEVGRHRGGSASFDFDVTDALGSGDLHHVTVRVQDDVRSGLQPGGKQSVLHQSFAASYTRTTGIWQSVWLESVPASRVASIHVLPDLDAGRFVVVPTLHGVRDRLSLHAIASDGPREVARTAAMAASGTPLVLDLPDPRAWSPDDPHLYDLAIELRRGNAVVDRVESYAGLRRFHVEGDRFFLNGEPIFLRLVLDQGFYPDGLWTAPSDDALRADIERGQALGFNGARLHQKVFEERFHYWADRLGYLTWGEFPDWGLEGLHFLPPRRDAIHQERAFDNHLREWCEVVTRDRNRPSIVVWTPYNEACKRKGRDRLYERAVRRCREQTLALDPTRPFHDASGWTHVATDVYSVHDYEQDPEAFRARHGAEPADVGEARDSFGGLPGAGWDGQPFVVDEYGGTWWNEDAAGDESWGYGDRPKSADDAVQRIEALTDVLLGNPRIAGYCYTQLTDIEQEQNGLYTYDRRPKFDAERLRAAFGAPAAIERRDAPDGGEPDPG